MSAEARREHESGGPGGKKGDGPQEPQTVRVVVLVVVRLVRLSRSRCVFCLLRSRARSAAEEARHSGPGGAVRALLPLWHGLEDGVDIVCKRRAGWAKAGGNVKGRSLSIQAEARGITGGEVGMREGQDGAENAKIGLAVCFAIVQCACC
jgi:hypothetical protein